VDELVERLVRWGDVDEKGAGGQAAVWLIDKLVELERQQNSHRSWGPVLSPIGDYSTYLATVKPTVLSSPRLRVEKEGTYLVRGEDVTFTWPPGPNSLIFCSGPVRTPHSGSGAILAGGSVEFTHDLGGSVVVCDGDCRLSADRRIAMRLLVIARGDVYCPKGTGQCTIIAGGKVHLADKRGAEWNVIRENEPNAFGFVRFFDPARIGLVTDPDAKDVRLKEVRRGTPFAQAGLRAGDLVLSVGGKDTPDREVFRRQLRRALARGEVPFTVRRDGKTLELTALPKE
jgi:membrane-associated protease RseP (regulator of RpoE activity)